MSEQTSSIDAIGEQIAGIIAAHAKLEPTAIARQSTLTDLGVASLDAIEVLFDVEEHFDIVFPDKGPDFNKDTVQDLVDLVTELVSKRDGGGAAA